MTEEEWLRIRNGIFAGESGGDYDALFGFSNREGKRFAGKRLTDMTVDEAIAFSQPQGEYGQWVKGQIGRVATPMGAYQVVGTTLRGAKEAMGLRGDERMDQATQDRIGKWILANQGTGAWEGYKGPLAKGPAPYNGGVSTMPDYARGALGGGYGGRMSDPLPSRTSTGSPMPDYAQGALMGRYNAPQDNGGTAPMSKWEKFIAAGQKMASTAQEGQQQQTALQAPPIAKGAAYRPQEDSISRAWRMLQEMRAGRRV